MRSNSVNSGVTRLLAVAVGIILAPPPLPAQIEGQVVDANDHPLGGVLVELWSPARRLAARITNSDGLFDFSAGETAGVTGLLARRVGFEPARVNVADGTYNVVVSLESLVIALPSIAVRSTDVCPVNDDTNARFVWSRMASRYDTDFSRDGVWTEALMVEGLVNPEVLGIVDTAELRPGRMVSGGPNWIDDVLLRGYATRYRGLQTFWYDDWRYEWLWSTRAYHFADSVFGELHNVRFLSEGSEGIEIVFCPKEVDQPEIQGVLYLASDTTLLQVSWEFVTPQPRERAGGRVLFAPVGPSNGPAYLLPAAGFYWRKRIYDYYQQWWEYREWFRCVGDRDQPCRVRRQFQ